MLTTKRPGARIDSHVCAFYDRAPEMTQAAQERKAITDGRRPRSITLDASGAGSVARRDAL